jgi:hypothetical protein
MKKIIFLLISLISFQSFGQSFNEDKKSIDNYIKRMYSMKPFEGVKIIEDYNDTYLISVLSLPANKYPNQSTLMRVAEVKSQSQSSTFLNGSNISMDMVMSTIESENNSKVKETTTIMVETIKQNSNGFVKSMELLTNFDISGGERILFVFIKKID